MRYITLIFILFTTVVGAQFNSEYYINHSNDTIKGEVIGYNSKVVYFLVNDEKIKLKPKDIKSFVVNDEFDKLVKYVTLKNDRAHFFEEAVVGQLSHYYLRTFNPYHGEKLIFPLLVKNDEIVYVNASNSKKRIAKLISDCPILLTEWTETNKFPDYDIIKITEAYNECSR
ncbi:hypothetical protein [Empedobacter brevis]|uniref:hypothetical protein n=1 Tax=Empedobacter brevis TaxID=247 RepID=UPI0028ABD00E|nr:hypothetical protein [Empedobacter brevis]